MDIKKIATQVINWHKKSGRKDLPWQIKINPYRVWISEIMLQQTQVATVIPYYERFMEEFPNIEKLANSPEENVLTHWAGLGYYSRARNLHKAAKMLYSQYKGEFPETINELSALPGIGRSTAGAILSLGMKISAPILDGNVKRVLARFYGIKDPVNKTQTINLLWKLSEVNTPKNQANIFNQGMMDLGATICTRTPQCLKCPLKNKCQAFENKITHEIPFVHRPEKKTKIKKSYFLIIKTSKDEVLLEKRSPIGIWGGLYCFHEFKKYDDLSKYCIENLSNNISILKKLPTFIHKFSHFNLEINPILLNISSYSPSKIMDSPLVLCTISEALKKAIPTPIKNLLLTLTR